MPPDELAAIIEEGLRLAEQATPGPWVSIQSIGEVRTGGEGE